MNILKIYILKGVVLMGAILLGRVKNNFLSDNETLKQLINGKSISRFGDGELVYMCGFYHMWQKDDARLKRKLRSIFRSTDEMLLVAVPDFLIDFTIDRKNINAEGWELPKYCLRLFAKPKTSFGSSFIFRPINSINNSNTKLIDKALLFFKSRDVVYVGTNSKYQDYISPLHIYNSIPEVDAFSHCYDTIFNDVVKICQNIKNPLVLITCGITGTVLSADLSKSNIQAVDVGSFFEQVSCLRELS
jgi:hypothetical protein